MGIFDRFKKTEPTPPVSAVERKPYGTVLVEIAKLISNGDEAVLRDISSCAENPQYWFQSHQEQYKNRGVDSAEDLELIQWLGLADILESNNWVCERDWKDELEDFLFFLQKLKGYQSIGLSLDPDWFDPSGDIPAWCNILAAKWESRGVRAAAIDIESDSYVLFPVSATQFPHLQKLAKEIGHWIDYVERM